MKHYLKIWIILLGIVGIAAVVYASEGSHDHNHSEDIAFPPSLDRYDDAEIRGIGAILSHRIAQEPFNLVASLIFLFAIIHTFLTSKFLSIAHRWDHGHEQKKKEGKVDKESVHFGAEIFHSLGEVEVVFGVWAVALVIAITAFYDWQTSVCYIGQKVNFTEPIFVVVIMTLASTRPILKLSELMMWKVANLFGGTLPAWWLTILTVGPVLGSLITEPAAMTISALLLANKFYDLQPSEKFKYATIGLLFVNISVGGTLTHFAAPPVLMVAGPWDWSFGFMLINFGWKAFLGILVSNGIYLYMFRNEMKELQKKYQVVQFKKQIQSKYVKQKDLEAEFDKTEHIVSNELGFTKAFDRKCEEIKAGLKAKIMANGSEETVDKSILEEAFEQRFEEAKLQEMRKTLPGLLPENERPRYNDPDWDNREDRVPMWIMLVHVGFMAWTIINAHHPALFVPGLLFFLGFAQATYPFQNRTNLKPPLLVGFFLGGLVVLGGVQAWWIAPVLGTLGELPLMLGATILTSINDNAAITYLSTLVPGFTAELKYAVVAGAVTGGGLTVIANAPNPAGQSLLKRYFENGVSPPKLLKAAIIPTIIMGLCFMMLRF